MLLSRMELFSSIKSKGSMLRYSPISNSWENVEVCINLEEGFAILALSTLSKKYLPKTLINMNNSAIASSPTPATDSAYASKRDADASECEAPSKTAKKSKTMASDGDEGTSANASQDENSNKEGLPEALQHCQLKTSKI